MGWWGPNGAGKSTLIRHLTGIYRQDSGQVLISGKEVWENAALKGPDCRDSGRLVLFPAGYGPGYDALLPGLLSHLLHRAL